MQKPTDINNYHYLMDFMYNELFFHYGQTSQIIVPVLRPGNAHSNWWYVSILKRIVKRIYAQYPNNKFYANFTRLLISSLAYELMLIVNEKIKKTSKEEKSKKWLVNNIRLFLF